MIVILNTYQLIQVVIKQVNTKYIKNPNKIMEKSQTTTENSFIVLLPTKTIPKQLLPLIYDQKDFSVRFINGYRNVLGIDEQSRIMWSLTENEDYCGQAFCYLLKNDVKKEELLAIKFDNNLEIHQTNDQMYILHTKSKQQLPNDALKEEQLNALIDEVSQSKETRKLALNLVKNSFDSYQDFKKLVEANSSKIEKQILEQQQEFIPTVAQLVDIEYEAKKVNGEMITKVPKCNNETGQWEENELIEIKLNV